MSFDPELRFELVCLPRKGRTCEAIRNHPHRSSPAQSRRSASSKAETWLETPLATLDLGCAWQSIQAISWSGTKEGKPAIERAAARMCAGVLTNQNPARSKKNAPATEVGKQQAAASGRKLLPFFSKPEVRGLGSLTDAFERDFAGSSGLLYKSV